MNKTFEVEIASTTYRTYEVKANGSLDLHGVALDREIPVTITIKKGEVSAESKFDVKVSDHKVEVPSMVFKKVAEVVQITFKSDFIEHSK